MKTKDEYFANFGFCEQEIVENWRSLKETGFSLSIILFHLSNYNLILLFIFCKVISGIKSS